MGELEADAQIRNCKNCGTHLAEETLYCPNCGQRTQNAKIPVWSVLSDFLYDQLNLDTRLYYALGKIWYPGKLTQVYFQGKRKSQSNPFRLFLIFAAVALGLFNLLYLRDFDDTSAVQIFDTEDVFTNVDDYNQAVQQLEKLITADSLSDLMTNTTLRDSVKSLLKLDREFVEIPNIIGDGLSDTEYIKVSTKDYYNLTPREIAQKYMSQLSGIERYVFQQQIKVFRNSDNLIPFMMGNIIWILFTQIIASAIILKLIYIRRKRYLIEHIVFSLHYQAFALLLTIIGILLYSTFNSIAAVLGLLLAVYVYIAMKVYYGQNYLKTFIKYFLYLTFTFMAFTMLMSIGQMLSILFF